MLSTLAIGLAAGVGQFAVAAFAATFVLGTLWILESLEPEGHALFTLEIKAKDASDLKARIEQVLTRQHVAYELRSTSVDDISYEVTVPLSRHTATISTAIAKIDPKLSLDVRWEKKKEK